MYEVMRAWDDSSAIMEEGNTKVVLGMHNGVGPSKTKKVVALSPVLDYKWRPQELQDMCLYDWLRLFEKKYISSKSRKNKRDIPEAVRDLKFQQETLEVESGDSEFENDYEVQETDFDDNGGDNFEDDPVDLKGGGVCSDESEDELLLTGESNKKLEEEIAQEKERKPHVDGPWLNFHHAHPQYQTHKVRLLKEADGNEDNDTALLVDDPLLLGY